MKYIASMSSDFCARKKRVMFVVHLVFAGGGRSSCQSFFSAIRKTLRIAELKDELRQEVKDTLKIVESDYLEGSFLLLFACCLVV